MGESMRCLSCNAPLTDYEATRRGANTNQFIDLCNRCFSTVAEDIDTIERADLGCDDELFDEMDDLDVDNEQDL